MRKNSTYTHLFGTIRLLIFSKKSHLYVYSVLYFYYFLRNFPTYIFIQTRRLFGTLEYVASMLSWTRLELAHKLYQSITLLLFFEGGSNMRKYSKYSFIWKLWNFTDSVPYVWCSTQMTQKVHSACTEVLFPSKFES